MRFWCELFSRVPLLRTYLIVSGSSLRSGWPVPTDCYCSNGQKIIGSDSAGKNAVGLPADWTICMVSQENLQVGS